MYKQQLSTNRIFLINERLTDKRPDRQRQQNITMTIFSMKDLTVR